MQKTGLVPSVNTILPDLIKPQLFLLLLLSEKRERASLAPPQGVHNLVAFFPQRGLHAESTILEGLANRVDRIGCRQ